MTRGQLAVIHLAVKQTGMQEEDYRALLNAYGVESSKDLSPQDFRAVMRHFEKCGFKGRDPHAGRAARRTSRERMLARMEMTLRDLGSDRAYANAVARQMYQVDRCEWLPDDQLRRVLAALEIHRRQRAAEAQAAGGAK